MSHWLDHTARGLAEGRFSRRQVLVRGGAVATAALLANVIRPSTGFADPVECETDSDCPRPFPEKRVYGLLQRISVSDDYPDKPVCCDGVCLTTDEHCCRKGAMETRCKNDERCCLHPTDSILYCLPDHFTQCGDDCCQSYELCCLRDGSSLCIDENFVTRCGLDCCNKDEHCCGDRCCDSSQQCCHSGDLAYCGPIGGGQCCPEGQHLATCGSGKDLCCPEEEYCCSSYLRPSTAVCCKPEDCHLGECMKRQPGCNPKVPGFKNCPDSGACCVNPKNPRDPGVCCHIATKGETCCYDAPATSATSTGYCCDKAHPCTICGDGYASCCCDLAAVENCPCCTR